MTVSILLVSGCRSYGGYGSEEAMYRQIERLVQRFAQDLENARADLVALENAAAQNSELALLAEQYAALVQGQEAILDEQRGLLADLSPGATYRSLHRAHGAIMAEQRTVRLQRQGLLRGFLETVDADTTAADRLDRPYALIPPYYNRIRSAQQAVSLRDVMRSERRSEEAAVDDASEGNQLDPVEGSEDEAPGSSAPAGTESGEAVAEDGEPDL